MSSELGQGVTFTVLVTGANTGLGLATCYRLIDEFLQTRPASHSIHLLFTTRDTKKRAQTLKAIDAHLGNILQQQQQEVGDQHGRAGTADSLAGPRITIQGLLVDLTRLLTVKALAQQLRREFGHVDAVVCNAGIGGWTGLHWGDTIRGILFDFMQATTFPTYQSCSLGAVTKPQLRPGISTQEKSEEPALGEVFTANVFGHYMLVHWLAPLLDAASRVVWISSLCAQPEFFTFDDFQRLHATEPYESSKRITDIMVLTSELPATKPYVTSFFSPAAAVTATATTTPKAKSTPPVLYLAQPGVAFTGITGLPWYLSIFILGSFYLARWLGSPWHTIDTYKAAVSSTWVCLAPEEQLREQELRDGKGKWGSVVTVYGDEGVKRTEVESWGFTGRIGTAPSGSVAGKNGRWRQRTAFTDEQIVEFEDQGRRVWQELETLREAWEKRLGPLDEN